MIEYGLPAEALLIEQARRLDSQRLGDALEHCHRREFPAGSIMPTYLRLMRMRTASSFCVRPRSCGLLCGARRPEQLFDIRREGASQFFENRDCRIVQSVFKTADIGSVERAERNVSIDNIARITKALAVEPWELFKG